MRHHAAVCLAVAVSEDPAGTLGAFREAVYAAAFGARRDALFDLLDALRTAGAVPSPVPFSPAAAQIQRSVARRPADDRLPLFVFDAGYDPVQLAQGLALATGGARAAILVRLRSGRCF